MSSRVSWTTRASWPRSANRAIAGPFLHDLNAGTRVRLFHNNTIRTIAPEYQWSVSPDGRRVLIGAERDGDTRVTGTRRLCRGPAGEDHRLDNTIRYSNPGIRDIQHAAAFLSTRLITYDALYFKSTDAAAYYDAYGDIVGGIGSYPVLSNPHYHQPHDLLEFENHELVAETSKTTAATLMLLASSPSRITGLTAEHAGSSVTVSWTPSPEKGVTSYLVASGAAPDTLTTRTTVKTPRAMLTNVPAGSVVAVKAVNARGLEGWDWARATVR